MPAVFRELLGSRRPLLERAPRLGLDGGRQAKPTGRKPIPSHLEGRRARAAPVSFVYDASNGRPTSMTDTVSVLFGYDAAGRRNTITTSDSVGITVGFDGTLAASETTTGAWPVTHTLNRSFSHYGELASWSLDSTTADLVMHDRDGLTTSNGPIGIGRGTNGLVKTIVERL